MLSIAIFKKLNLIELGNEKNQPTEAKSASDWFCRLFPEQVKVHGAPFLDQSEQNLHGSIDPIPLIPNIDFFAACLGGDPKLGHRIVYYPPELQFYFYDPRDQMFHPTTAEKLGNLYRALLAKCAGEVKGEGHLFNIFHTFRSDHVVKQVINRAKSILAADPDFFGADSPNERVAGPELHERLARVFAEQMLESSPNSILTLGQTYALFSQFAQTKNMPPLDRRLFKQMMAPVIKDAYGVGVRNDLISAETEKQQCGWKGLRAVDAQA